MRKINLFFILSSLLSILTTQMAESAPQASAVHIIYTERPQGNEEAEAYHLRILSSVVGSDELAKEALLYSYKHAASGFSAKLTPDQVTQMSRQPGVLQVVESKTVQLHSGPETNKRKSQRNKVFKDVEKALHVLVQHRNLNCKIPTLKVILIVILLGSLFTLFLCPVVYITDHPSRSASRWK